MRGRGQFIEKTRCAGTFNCFHDRNAATKPTNPRAHLWGRFYSHFDVGDFDVQKVKAHCSAADVDRGIIKWWERAGNNWADVYAKKGARLRAPPKEDAILAHLCNTIAFEAATWSASLEADLGDKKAWDCDPLDEADDVTLDVVGEPRGGIWAAAAPEPSGLEPARKFGFRGHGLVEASFVSRDDTILYCAHCGSTFSRQTKCGGLAETCRGSAAVGLATARARLNGGHYADAGGYWAIGDTFAPSADRLRDLHCAAGATFKLRTRPSAANGGALRTSTGVLACYGLRQGPDFDKLFKWAEQDMKSKSKRKKAANDLVQDVDDYADYVQEFDGDGCSDDSGSDAD